MGRKAVADEAVKKYLEAEKEEKDADLLPCPFCGGKAVSWVIPSLSGIETRTKADVAACFCEDCKARVTVTREEMNDVIRSIAVAKWNRRTHEKS